MIWTLTALVVLLAATSQGNAWDELWVELERLRTGELRAPEEQLIRGRLAQAAEAHTRDPRSELLRAGLEALAGRDVSAVALRLAELSPDPFTPREHWFLADSLPGGPERARVLLSALRATPALARWQLLLAWSVAVDEARALRLEEHARPIQTLLHERYQADWSAMDLAMTCRLLGDRACVDQVLIEAIAREAAAGRPTRELWSQLGIATWGFGDTRLARDYLGKALALGSDDAALVLSRIDLLEGRVEVARRGFRASILSVPPPDWAWRGWGMTLLPEAHAHPATRSASTLLQP